MFNGHCPQLMEPKMQKILSTDTTAARAHAHDFDPSKSPGRARNIIWLNNGKAKVRRGRFGGDRGDSHRNFDDLPKREQERLESALSGGQKVRKCRFASFDCSDRYDID